METDIHTLFISNFQQAFHGCISGRRWRRSDGNDGEILQYLKHTSAHARDKLGNTHDVMNKGTKGGEIILKDDTAETNFKTE